MDDGYAGDKNVSLELIVDVININMEKGNKILENCKILRDYSLFVESVRKHAEIDPENGFEKAIRECMENEILKEYLERKSKEVRNMLTAEYDYATDIAVQREEEREIALEKGIYKEKENIVLKMVSRGLDVKTISEYTDLDISEIKKIQARLQ